MGLTYFEKSCAILTKGLPSSNGLTKKDRKNTKDALAMHPEKMCILRAFRLDGAPVSCENYGCGHINATFLAATDTGRRYILQRINHRAFRTARSVGKTDA